MNSQGQPLRRGRKSKDEALVLRDQYWALFVKSKFPQENYASLERLLYPQLQIKRREDLLGYSQPFALSKVVKGTRGLSATTATPPPVVLRAEVLIQGATEAFTSILWTSLLQPMKSPCDANPCGSISTEVTRRLSARHFDAKSEVYAGIGLLNELGIRRLSRLKHRDSLGLLLFYCPAVMGVSKLSLIAEAYVLNLFRLCCQRDPALMSFKEVFMYLIAERYRLRQRTDSLENVQIFLAPRVSSLVLSLRLLIGA